MAQFDFGSNAILHVGKHSRAMLAALAVGLMSSHALAESPKAPTKITVAPTANKPMISFEKQKEAFDKASISQNKMLSQMEADNSARFLEQVNTLSHDKGNGTCFAGFLNDNAHQAEIENSTVMLVTLSKEGNVVAAGSGFVVDNSDDSTGHRKIVTARHVVNAGDTDSLSVFLESAQKEILKANGAINSETVKGYLLSLGHPELLERIDDFQDAIEDGYSSLRESKRDKLRELIGGAKPDHIEAYNSRGDFLGVIKVTAAGIDGKEPTKFVDEGTNNPSANPNDWAVATIDLKKTTKTAVAKFDGMSGLKIAPLQAPEKTKGISGDMAHPGATHGYSGGPVVDNETGMVVGVVSAGESHLETTMTILDGMKSAFTIAHPEASFTAHNLIFGRTVLVTNPLGNPKLLEQLGEAGKGVTISDNAASFKGTSHLTMAGMPNGYCAAAPAAQGPINGLMRDLVERSPGAPTPLEVRMVKGVELSYDINAKLKEVKQPDGTVRKYESGVPVSESRPDGTRISFANGKALIQSYTDPKIVDAREIIEQTPASYRQ